MEPSAQRALGPRDFASGAASFVFLGLVLEAYQASMKSAGFELSGLKLRLLSGLLIFPLICVGVTVLWQRSLFRALLNLGIGWGLFSVYFAVALFSRFPMLNKDLPQAEIAKMVAVDLLLGLPLILVQAGILWLWHRELWVSRRKG